MSIAVGNAVSPVFQNINPVSFSPFDISGLEVWLDADDSSTINFPTGWNDKSGNGNNALVVDVVPTIASGQINGKDAIEFVYGSNDYLQTAAFASELSQPNTIFIIGYTSAVGSINIILDGIVSTKRHLVAYLGGTNTLRIQSNTSLDFSGTWDIPNILTAIFNSPTSTLYQNSVSLGSGVTGTQGLTGLTIGNNYIGSNNFGGWIGEILVYNSLLSSSERLQVEDYLTVKWGI